MANVIYNSFKQDLFQGLIDFSSDTIRVALVTSSYTPDQDVDHYFEDVTDEVVSTGYTAGGQEITGKTFTIDTDANTMTFDADDLQWTGVTFWARGLVIYKDTGDDSTSPLIVYMDFGEDKKPDATDFAIKWNDSGIIRI